MSVHEYKPGFYGCGYVISREHHGHPDLTCDLPREHPVHKDPRVKNTEYNDTPTNKGHIMTEQVHNVTTLPEEKKFDAKKLIKTVVAVGIISAGTLVAIRYKAKNVTPLEDDATELKYMEDPAA